MGERKNMEKNVSKGFSIFIKETHTGKYYMNMVKELSKESVLDPKTQELAYIAVLAATKMYSGLDFHIKSAIELKASKEEIKSAVLVGLPVVGMNAIEALEFVNQVFKE